METTATRRIISDKSAQAQRVINQKNAKAQPSVPETTAELPKEVANLKAQLEALTPEQKKLLLKEVKATKARSMTRMDAVCTALKDHNPETVEAWIKATNEVFGSENNQESLFNIRYAQKVLKHFNIAFPEK